MYHYFCKTINIYDSKAHRVDSSTMNITYSKVVHCQNNSVLSDGGNSTNITITCTPKGEWHYDDEKCECDKGFSFDTEKCSRK